jgi:hypothetical protein
MSERDSCRARGKERFVKEKEISQKLHLSGNA